MKRVNFEAMCMANLLQSALNASSARVLQLRLPGFHVPSTMHR